MIFCAVFELMANGIWSPVKADLVYCFHKVNKAQKEHQKIGFSPRVGGEKEDRQFAVYIRISFGCRL